MKWNSTTLLMGAIGFGMIAVPTSAAAATVPVAGLRIGQSDIFLPNIDDDAGGCRSRARQLAADAVPREEANEGRFQVRKEELSQEPDQENAEREFAELRRAHQWEQNQADRDMAACNDAADTVVNGPEDETDLARLRIAAWTGAPDSAAGRLTVSAEAVEHVRLFIKRGQWELVTGQTVISGRELRQGAELGIEGRDVVRDRAVWDGRAGVTLTVTAGRRVAQGTVQLREAPVLTQVNTQRLQAILATGPSADSNVQQWHAVVNSAAQPTGGLRELDVQTEWMQDLFEPAYTSMPGPDGRPHGIRVLIKTANDTHRVSARVVFTDLAGPGVAALHIGHEPVVDEDGGNSYDTYDSMGNLETIPPTPGHPSGQIIVGGDGVAGSPAGPAKELLGLLRAQRGIQEVTRSTPPGWRSATSTSSSSSCPHRAAGSAGGPWSPILTPGWGCCVNSRAADTARSRCTPICPPSNGRTTTRPTCAPSMSSWPTSSSWTRTGSPAAASPPTSTSSSGRPG
ncbi:hypothetical protein Cci01nite_82370 [Catellatospora citrea]|uniref:Protein-arginine deiminase C-terminal domain-containing protein n=1 Tax=Catellatospora citrea TaxID=53366 RepID=A0A8J3KTI1_9ACTN|nr:hypothetical protein Cci01nite_82370 [Catellatospora citrea]